MTGIATDAPAGLQWMAAIRDGVVLTDAAGRELARATATCHVRGA